MSRQDRARYKQLKRDLEYYEVEITGFKPMWKKMKHTEPTYKVNPRQEREYEQVEQIMREAKEGSARTKKEMKEIERRMRSSWCIVS